MNQFLDIMRSYFTRERIVLLICMGISAIFWLLNRLSTKSNRIQSVRVEYVLPTGRALRAAPPQYVAVTWQGSGWDLLADAQPKVSLTLDTAHLQSFAMRSVVGEQLGNAALGVSPEQIMVELEPSMTKILPLKAIHNLTYVKGFDLAGDIELTPSVVRVKGPISVMQDLDFVKTDTLIFEKLKDTLTTKAFLTTSPMFQFDQTEFSATIPVEQFTEKSLFVPLVVKNAPSQLRIFPNRIKVDCSVALSRYQQLTASDFVVEMDLKHVDFKSKKNNEMIVLTRQPSFVRKVKFYPQSASFYFEK